MAEVLGVDVAAVDGLAEFSVGALAGRRHDDPELASVFKAWMHGDERRFIPGGESGARSCGATARRCRGSPTSTVARPSLVFTTAG